MNLLKKIIESEWLDYAIAGNTVYSFIIACTTFFSVWLFLRLFVGFLAPKLLTTLMKSKPVLTDHLLDLLKHLKTFTLPAIALSVSIQHLTLAEKLAGFLSNIIAILLIYQIIDMLRASVELLIGKMKFNRQFSKLANA